MKSNYEVSEDPEELRIWLLAPRRTQKSPEELRTAPKTSEGPRKNSEKHPESPKEPRKAKKTLEELRGTPKSAPQRPILSFLRSPEHSEWPSQVPSRTQKTPRELRIALGNSEEEP